MKTRISQTIPDGLSKVFKTSKRKSIGIESERGKDFYSSFSQNFFKLDFIYFQNLLIEVLEQLNGLLDLKRVY